jgi:alpha-tubulin suppressor-like RCC1 family protein
MGDRHACAIPTTGGGVMCWGNNTDNRVSDRPTTGTFASVTIGTGHTCAMRDDGTELCWGSNSYGESTAP